MHDEARVLGFKARLEETLKSLHQEVQEALLAEDPQRHAELLDIMREGGESRAVERLHELNLASVRRHLAQIRAAEAALERIANGHFGVCTHCGDDIPAARLDVQPAAARCVACQAEQEAAATGN